MGLKEELAKRGIGFARNIAGKVLKSEGKVPTTYTSTIKAPGLSITTPGVTSATTTGTPLSAWARGQAARAEALAAKGKTDRAGIANLPYYLSRYPKLSLAAGGLGAYGLFNMGQNAVSGMGETPKVDLSQVYNPMTAAQEAAAMQANMLVGLAPDPQSYLNLLNQYAGKTPGAAGGGIPASTVAGQQAQAGLTSAAAPTGTAVSGLTPVAGPVSTAADALIQQGGTFNDYLNTLESFAKAAGVNMNNATRERLRQEATRAYTQRMNLVNEELGKVASGLMSAQMDLSGLTPYIPTKADINDAIRQSSEAAKVGMQITPEQILSSKARTYYNLQATGGK